MKFGKNLQRLIEEALPEWRDKFIAYKRLKKLLKVIAPKAQDEGISQVPRKRQRIETQGESHSSTSRSSDGLDLTFLKYKLTAEEVDFIQLLYPELEKFNHFFMEKEEEYIIHQKELQDRIERVKDTYGLSPAKFRQEMMSVRKDFVNFHGEMVLLENYSVLNYTGLVKILKKYDKRRGGILRLAFIEKVLEQPFFAMEVLFKLVKECEETLEQLFAREEEGRMLGEEEEATVYVYERGHEEEMHRSTMAALRSMREMRKGSSTFTALSLPPLQKHNNYPSPPIPT
ncbi:SPX domain-containing protein 1 [Cryptomeria japonica]|uniref:SPX domain-containing protein 1 n=1 Tax=Cryptomeria japonica TaxID=3369 RepID=UPI0025AC98AF|nr:SPX domain-containing protein 1 [Cryptomeria japonica]XP_057818840.1 SPX domain-containing protein 1 [Cryptomeria japonica]